jgi:RNA polymerase sigma-70 factor (ECF subfamily)
LRRRKRHEVDAVPPSATGEMFDALDREEFIRSVETALRGLPPEQREVVVLKIWGELTFAQIGDALAINPETAASRYRYGLGRLQTTLRQETAS